MRTAATLNTPTPPPTTSIAKASMSTPATMQQRSPWHSPVPYLFGGLAAMLGLIAFALLILACSYWKLSGSQAGNGDDDDQRDLENGGDEKTGDGGIGKAKIVYQEKFVVIMAGDVNPTCLATPTANYCKASSLGGDCVGKSENMEEGEKTEKEKQLEQSTTAATMEEESHEERETQVSQVIHEQTQ